MLNRIKPLLDPTRRGMLAAGVVAVAAPGLVLASEGGRRFRLSGYRLTFEDTFETLDISAWGPGTRWIAHTYWNGDFGDAAFADPEPGFPFTTSNEGLRIEARQFPDGRWRSGLICSGPVGSRDAGGWGQAFGYFEMEARLPDGDGVWPAFWLVTWNEDPGIEIDIMEFYGRNPGAYHWALHVREPNGTHIEQRGGVHPVRRGLLSERYNRYGVLIEPDVITYTFNRRVIAETPAPRGADKPFYILANLALGSGWPIDRLTSPQFMDIRSIRAWAREDQ